MSEQKGESDKSHTIFSMVVCGLGALLIVLGFGVGVAGAVKERGELDYRTENMS
jgi:hypothetical protein